MSDVVESSPGALAGARNAVRETGASLASVFRNANLRRIQLALAGSMIGDWAYATAVAVWAYQVGGAKVVGIWAAVRLTLMAFGSPVGATIADRMSRRTLMVVVDLVRAVLVAAAAGCLYLGLHPLTVFVLASVTTVVGTPFRPAQRSLMPSLANHPEELTASNGTSSTIESLAFFVGPALGALLIGVADVPVVFLLNAATFVWSMAFVLRVRMPTPPRHRAATAPPEDEPPPEAGPGFLGETLAGFRAIGRDRDLLVVTVEICGQTLVAGASAVFMVVMAVDLLQTGPKGVGYLNSVFGIGAIVGGFVAISRSSHRTLAQDMTAGVVLWALPLLLVTAWAAPAAAFAAVLLLGFGNPLVDVNMDTIVQRIVPDDVMGRVFGALEAVLVGTMAIGSVITPFLIGWLGLRLSMAVLGIFVTVVALLGLPRMRSLDGRLRRPAGLPLLQGVPMFLPLAPAVVEALASRLVAVQVTAGGVVLREGEESDRFYVIEAGLVEVTQAGAVLRREGPGDFFGEIGLLRDVPRTATISAVEDTTLQALERADFLEAVTGQREARRVADEVVARRLAV